MGQMTIPPQAWPDANEELHASQAITLNGIRTDLEAQRDVWLQSQTKVFDGSTWFDGAASAAQGKVQNHIAVMSRTSQSRKSLRLKKSKQ